MARTAVGRPMPLQDRLETGCDWASSECKHCLCISHEPLCLNHFCASIADSKLKILAKFQPRATHALGIRNHWLLLCLAQLLAARQPALQDDPASRGPLSGNSVYYSYTVTSWPHLPAALLLQSTSRSCLSCSLTTSRR